MGKAKVNLNSVTTVGLDLGKHVFQIHAVDVDGRIVITSALRRKDVLSFFGSLPPCVIGLEACGSAHHWAHELTVESRRRVSIGAPRRARGAPAPPAKGNRRDVNQCPKRVDDAWRDRFTARRLFLDRATSDRSGIEPRSQARA
jgi:hypothetical protein